MPVERYGERSYGKDEADAFSLYDFSLGLNVKKLPQQLDDRELSVALNVYLRAEGGIEMRKGIAKRGAALSAAPGSNVYRLFQNVKNGAVQSPPLTMTVAQVGGNLYNADTNTQIGANNVVGVGALPMSCVRFYNSDHTIAGVLKPSDGLVICTGVGGPYFFDGDNVYAPAGWSAALGARWCASLNGMVFFGGIPGKPNTVVASLIGHPETLLYFFPLSHPVTGLCAAGSGPNSGMVVGMAKGMAVLYGTGPQNFYRNEIAMNDGCIAGRTMIAINGIVYYLGRCAVYAFDGQQSYAVSDQVEPYILNDPLAQDYAMNGDRSLSFAWWYLNRLYIAYDATNVGYCNTYLVMHANVNNGWTVLNGPKLAGVCILDAPGDGTAGNPSPCVAIDATKGQLYNFDVYNGSGHSVDDDGVTIQTVVLSKYFKIGEPGVEKRIKRMYPEFFTEKFGGSFVAFNDYGATNISQVISGAPTATQMTWDVSQWDAVNWAGSNPLSYLKQRVDSDLRGEAFAFGVVSNDNNPPYRWVGVSGQFVEEARN